MALTRSIYGVYDPAHKLVLLLTDIVTLALAFHVASYIRLKEEPSFLSLEYIGLSMIVISCLFLGGAYTSGSISRRPKLPLNTFFVAVASALPGLMFVYALGPEHFTALLGRGVFPFAIIGFGVLAVFSRYLINYVFHTPGANRKVLLLSPLDLNERLKNSLTTSGTRVSIIHAKQLCSENHPKDELRAIVVSPDHLPAEEEQQILLDYRLAGVPIFSLSDFFENFLFLVPVQEINNDWFIRSQGFTMLHSPVTTRLKRAIDLIAATALLTLSLPLMIFAIIVTMLGSRGPILFTQQRVGMHGDIFTIYKFRTMQVDAEQSGAQWASDNDSRITPMGNFLRKTRIDELPQCWNILKGEMSIVGPRPERPEFTSLLAEDIPYYDLRHVVKPGLTGWAQVSFPYGASIEDSLRKLQYDLYYIKNYSLLLDLNILLRTVLVTLRKSGR